jgi:cobyrinic acid a,c-diamide synthase
MYLAAGIRDVEGRRHSMVGLIPGEVVMRDRLQALGYVEVETQHHSLLGPPGLRFRGHEFRYSELQEVPTDVDLLYRIRRRRGDRVFREGYRCESVLASYVHAHWASNPMAAAGFVEACARHAGRMQ